MKQARNVIPIRPEPGARLSSAERGAVRAVIEAHRHRPGNLLEVLHGVQAALGHVPEASIELIAHELNLSRAEVHGVISFYHDFRDQPPDRPVVQLCRAEACQAVGARALEAHLQSHAEAVELAPVYCLGNCACSPAIMVDGKTIGRVDAKRFDEIVANLEGGAS